MRLSHSLLVACAAFVAAAVVAPREARAADLQFGARTDLWFDNNVYAASDNEVSDFSLNLSPTVELKERWSTLEARVFVRPEYELFFDEQRIRGFNTDAEGQLAWKPSARTTLQFNDSFMRYRSLRGFTVTGGAQPPVLGREPFTRNSTSIALVHRTSAIGQLQLSAYHAYWEFTQRGRVDQANYGGTLKYDSLIVPRLRIGGLVQFSRKEFERSLFGSPPHTDYVNGSFTLTYLPAESFTFSASAGPTWIRQPLRQPTAPSLIRLQLMRFDNTGAPFVGIPGSCPTLAGGAEYDGPGCTFVPWPLAFLNLLQLAAPIPLVGALPRLDGSRWTYFADANLSKEWERAKARFSYRRDQGSSSGIGFSTIADTIELSASWEFSRLFFVTLSTNYETRKETQDAAATRLVTVLGTIPSVSNLVPVGLAVAPVSATRERV